METRLDRSLYNQPELELVLNAIRLNAKEENCISDLLRDEINWSLLLQIANFHQVFPLVYTRLKEVENYEIPPGVEAEFKMVFQANAYRNLRLSRKLILICENLSLAGIENIFSKGPITSLLAYNNLAMRQFNDIDLFIHQEDFPRVYEILVEGGGIPAFPLKQHEQKWLVKNDIEFSFYIKEDLLDVQWYAIDKGKLFPLNNTSLWKDKDKVLILGREVEIFSRENQILYACLHGSNHQWGILKWVTDLAYLCQAFIDIDWIAFINNARRIGFYRLVCLSLGLACEIGGLILPDNIKILVEADQVTRKLLKQKKRELISSISRQSFFPSPGFYLQTRERLRDKAYYLLDQIFFPKQVDWRSLQLPEFLYSLYFIIRPMRLIFKFSKWFIFSRSKTFWRIIITITFSLAVKQ